jgi:hypothetical protein
VLCATPDRPGVIFKEENETITSYLSRIESLSKKRNLLAHGVWIKDKDKQIFFRAKAQPGSYGTDWRGVYCLPP